MTSKIRSIMTTRNIVALFAAAVAVATVTHAPSARITASAGIHAGTASFATAQGTNLTIHRYG